VLSDKHERAWYDSHRDAILRSGSGYQAGGDGGVGAGQPPDSEVDLYPYFSAACFKGYGDGSQSFYGVYGDVFARLATAEREAGAPAGMPAFGIADAAWSTVSDFYDWWTAFLTVKDFAWADEYNPASAPNRKVRRLMEDDNRKRRAKARREFNETVRELAAFVRKRDKRVAAQAADVARAKAQREQEAAARRDAEKRERAARAQAYQEAAWVRGGGSSADDGSDGGAATAADAAPLLHCVACDKLFRSAGAMANHERSKKHAEAVAALRAMLAEDEASGGGAPGSGDEEEATTDDDEEDASETGSNESEASSGSSTDDEDDDARSSNSRASSALRSSPSSPSSTTTSASSGSVDDDEFVARLLAGAAGGSGAGVRRRPPTTPPSSSSSSSSPSPLSEDEDAPSLPDMDSLAVRDGETETVPPSPPPAAAAAEGKPTARARRATGRGRGKGAAPAAPICRVCGETFTSRGLLFKHLEATGHARATV
jgi:DnaJ family protein A protein 5